MNLYLVSQDVNNDYDTFDAMVVCAESEAEAKAIHPRQDADRVAWRDEWCRPEDVRAKFIGTAASDVPNGVVLSSYNAG